MSLTSDLISQFVKVTNDKQETVDETTVYGTIVEVGDSKYVRLDGSPDGLLTPIDKTVNAKDGERVTVMIKNHTATVTGNLSSPAARLGDVEATDYKISAFEFVLANKVDTDTFIAEQGRVDELLAENITVTNKIEAAIGDIDELVTNNLTVTGRLDAMEADIRELVVGNLDVTVLDAKYAKIEDLNTTNAKVYNLESTYANFNQTTTQKLTAAEADIDKLETNKLSSSEALVTYAKIADLDAVDATVTTLESDVAKIDTLIFGSASGSTIQTSFANAVIALLGDAQIESAMIKDVAADKITSGDIITNNVRVRSKDGLLLISDETIQISDSTRVRVQIGKDSSNDYSINIWDAYGNLMFSEGGITDNAIKEAIIRNDMVSDTANIAAHKLDIDSLFEEINGSTNIIKSTRVYLDDLSQTLDVAFKTLETEVSGLGTTVSSHGTQLSVVQGAIESKVWQQDINRSIDSLDVSGRNLYIVKNSFEGFMTVNGTSLSAMHSLRKEHTSEYIPVAEGEPYVFQVWVTVDESDTEDYNLWMAYDYFNSDKVAITARPAKRSLNKLPNGQCYDIYKTTVPANAAYIRVSARLYSDGLIKLEKGNVPTEWSPAPEDVDGNIDTLTTQFTSLQQTVNGLSTTVASYKTQIDNKADSGTVTNVSNKVATLEQTVNGFETSVTETVNTALASYATASQMETAMQQNADSITTSVSKTYATKTSVDKLSVGGRNLFIAKNATSGFLSSNGNGSIMAAGDVTKEQTSDLISVEPGDEIAFQVWVTTPEDSYVWYGYQFFKEDGTALNESRPSIHLYDMAGGYYHATYDIINVPDGASYIRVSARMFEDGKIKVEKGNKPTDWTPAPEDMATSDDNAVALSAAETAQETATTAETLVQQLSDAISVLVTDGNGTSLMTQTESGWTFSTAEIQSAVASTAESLNALIDDVGDTEHAVEVLQQAVADLGEIAEYVKIGTYENEPCIELGEGDSEFKLRITNTRILFMEGSSVIAHFTNQSLHIKKAVIEEELQQGDFVWQIRSNGNLGLIWKG